MKTNAALITNILITTTLLSGTILASTLVSAENDSVVDEINITVPVSCTLSGTGMNTHNAEINNGQYNSAIGETTLKAFCNDNNGFAIYAIGYTDNEEGKNVLTSSTLGSTYDITTGTAITGNDSNWAMKLSTITSPTPTYPIIIAGSTDDTDKEQGDPDYSSFQEVPDDYALVAKRTSGTDIGQSAEGATLKSTYQAYISKTQPAGTYTGQVKYTLVHPHTGTAPAHPIACDAGKICYNPNTTAALGEMGKQTVRNNSLATLYAPNFSRSGYGFAGWNTTFDYTGTFYGPNETITAPSDVQTKGLSLYAVWIKSAGILQNWDGCSGLAQGATTALTDERDGSTYAVAKLADNKCWIIENLRLADKDSNNNDVILSNANTRNPSLPLTNSDGITTSNSLSASIDPTTTDWCYNYNSACIDKSMLATNNTTGFTSNTSTNYDIEGDVFSYGNYYNWYSATAGRGKYGSSYGAGYNATGDICPIGWHLPTGGLAGEYYNLSAALDPSMTSSTTDNNLYLYPNNFVYSGSADGASVGNRGWDGSYWSSTAYSNDNAYELSFDMDDVYLENYSEKFFGSTVRCIIGV